MAVATVQIRIFRGGEEPNDLRYLFRSLWDGGQYTYSGLVPPANDAGDYMELAIEGDNDALAEDIGWDTDI